MKSMASIFKVLGDENRLRILMVLDRKELCVCQLMAIIGQSQPLISRNLSILNNAGFLDERKEGKLRFYRIKKNLGNTQAELMAMLRRLLKDDDMLLKDLETLKECNEFQKKTGRCDMKTFREFQRWRQRKHAEATPN